MLISHLLYAYLAAFSIATLGSAIYLIRLLTAKP
jgi:hypothetical protein